MPKVTLWIRKEDYAVWKQIEDVPEWLHGNLRQQAIDWEDNKLINEARDE